jgi:hypothetical protein
MSVISIMIVVIVVVITIVLLSFFVSMVYASQLLGHYNPKLSTTAYPLSPVSAGDVPPSGVPAKKKIIMKINNPTTEEILIYYFIQGNKTEVYKGKANSTLEISIPQDADKIELRVIKDKIDITDILLDGQSIIHTLTESYIL